MNKLFLLIVSFFVLINTLNAQRIEQDLVKAKQLKKEYPDEKVVCLSSESVFNFFITSDKDEDMIEVDQNTEQRFISLIDYAEFVTFLYYDENSEISRLDVRGRNNKKESVVSLDQEYNGNGIFHSDGRMKLYDLGFDTKGEIKRSYYSKTYFNILYFPSVFFQEYFPVMEKTLIFNIPDWLDLELMEQNFEGYTFEKNIEKNPKQKTTTITYVFKNLDTPPDERKSFGPTYYMPHLLLLAKSYNDKGVKKNLFGSVDDLYDWYKSLVKQGKTDREVLKPIVEELIADKQTDEEKIKSIYYWVQDNIRYIAFEDGLAGFKPEDADKVYQNRYGDCKGMANLTKHMLIIAGFDARLTWLGTRHIAYSYDIPSLAVDNHMICTLIHGGKKIYLDATEEFIAYGALAERIQGRQVLIEDGDSYILETVPVVSSTENLQETTVNLILENDGRLTGTMKMEFIGEAKMDFQRNYQSLSSSYKDDALRVYLSDGDKNISIDKIETIGLNDRDIPLIIKSNISMDNQVAEFDDDMYITIDKDKEFEHFDIDSTRFCDWLFSYKLLFRSEVRLAIPEAYKVSYCPDNLKIITDDFSFDISYSYTDTELKYSKIIEISNGVIRKKDFDSWNSLIEELKKLYNDQVILSKI